MYYKCLLIPKRILLWVAHGQTSIFVPGLLCTLTAVSMFKHLLQVTLILGRELLSFPTLSDHAK